MLSSIRLAAARQFRTQGVLSACRATRLASRAPANRQPPVNLPTGYRFQLARRAFSGTTAQFSAQAKSGAKSGAKKPARKTASKKATPKSKKRTRKVLSEEDKKKNQLRQLKKLALLHEPTKLPDRSWLVFIGEKAKGTHLNPGDFGPRVAQLSEAYKNLPTHELERLQAVGKQNKVANDAAYKKWVESHTPQEIAAANRARNHLKRAFKMSSKGQIRDERQPRRAQSAYLLFAKSKWQSGDFTGIKVTEAARSISSEWKALSDAERQHFFDDAKVDLDRYVKEMKSILNRDVHTKTA